MRIKKGPSLLKFLLNCWVLALTHLLCFVDCDTASQLPPGPAPREAAAMYLPKELWTLVDYLLQQGLDHVRGLSQSGIFPLAQSI